MTQNPYKTDADLKSAIVEELGWTPEVDAERIGVAVTEGAVTLSGQVATYPEKAAATNAALRVGGVTAVADGIVVANDLARRDDGDLAREAAKALSWMVSVPAGTVQATVQDHVITLTGTVERQFQRVAVQRTIAGLRGVRDVRNRITLTPSIVAVSGADAEAKIIDAMVRNARLDAQLVHVTVAGTGITLTGNVSSWAESRQAAHAAWASPGVTEVDNRLVVVS